MLSLFLVIYYFDECFQAALGQSKLNSAEAAACQLYKAFLSSRIFPDVPAEAWPKIQEILAGQEASKLAEFSRVLPRFMAYVGENLRRYYNSGAVQRAVFELRGDESKLQLQIFGIDEPRSPQLEELEEERKGLADLQSLLHSGCSTYFEEEVNGKRRMILEVKPLQRQ